MVGNNFKILHVVIDGWDDRCNITMLSIYKMDCLILYMHISMTCYNT